MPAHPPPAIRLTDSARLTPGGEIIGPHGQRVTLPGVDWRAIRQRLGWTQAEMARAACCAGPPTVSQWEGGTREPSRQSLRALHAAMQVHAMEAARKAAAAKREAARAAVYPPVARFNMVEVVLAMAVIAIGVTALVGLIPLGVRAAHDTAELSYAAHAGQMLASHLASVPGAAASLPHDPPTGVATTDAPTTSPRWAAVPGMPQMYRCTDPGAVGVYRLYVSAGSRTTINAVLRCWQQPHTVCWPDGTTFATPAAVVEISWPASAAHRDRQSATFVELARE